MQAPKRWPLAGTLGNRSNNFLKDGRLVNAYAEKDRATGLYQVEKRGGFAAAPAFTGIGLGQGIYTYPYIVNSGGLSGAGIYYATLYVTESFPNSMLYSFITTPDSTSGPTSAGMVAFGMGTKFQFLGIPNGGAATQVLLGGSNLGGVGNVYVWSASGLTTIACGGSTGFPYNNVSGFVYLNGYCYVMDSGGTIWQTTAQNVVTGAGSWGGTAFIAAASDNDYGVQLARQLIYVVAIKSYTTQFFYDAGNPTGSSLSPLPGALYNFGCVSSDTFADLDGVLFWATQSRADTSRIVMVTNLQYEFVSTPAVERMLNLGTPNTVWRSVAYTHAGHSFYVITNVTANITMVYDVGEKLWYQWTDYQGNAYPVIARAVSPQNTEWQQMATTGNVYQMDADYVYPNDSGHVVPVDIYTPNFDAGVDRIKYLSQMRFNADQTAGSSLLVRSSDDDYQTWNSFRKVDLSVERPLINDEGSFYRRAYHFRHFANTRFRLSSVDLQMDVGTL